MDNLEGQLRFQTRINDLGWPKDNEYKAFSGRQLVQETGRDLVSISHAAVQLRQTIDIFLDNRFCEAEIWTKYQQNAMFLPQQFVESVFAQFQKLLKPGLKKARERILKVDKKSNMNMLHEIFEVRGRNQKSAMPWQQPVKVGEKAATLEHLIQDTDEAMEILDRAMASLAKKSSRRKCILDGNTTTFPTRPAREMLLELAIREKLGRPSEAAWTQLASSITPLNLDYGPQKTPFVVVDEKIFSDDLSPKMFFVSADEEGGDWIIGSTQPSCGKWLFDAHIFMEKIRNHQLGDAYESLYQKVQTSLQQFEQVKLEAAKEKNLALLEADRLKPRVLLGRVRQAIIEEFHHTGKGLGMYSMTGLAFLRDLTYSKMCMRCQYLHGYKEVMDFDPATTLQHYEGYNWDHRGQKAHSCAEANTALQCAILRRDLGKELWDRKADYDTMDI